MLGIRWTDKVSTTELYTLANTFPLRVSILKARWKGMREALCADASDPMQVVMQQYFCHHLTAAGADDLPKKPSVAFDMAKMFNMDARKIGRSLVTSADYLRLKAEAQDPKMWEVMMTQLIQAEKIRVGVSILEATRTRKLARVGEYTLADLRLMVLLDLQNKKRKWNKTKNNTDQREDLKCQRTDKRNRTQETQQTQEITPPLPPPPTIDTGWNTIAAVAVGAVTAVVATAAVGYMAPDWGMDPRWSDGYLGAKRLMIAAAAGGTLSGIGLKGLEYIFANYTTDASNVNRNRNRKQATKQKRGTTVDISIDEAQEYNAYKTKKARTSEGSNPPPPTTPSTPSEHVSLWTKILATFSSASPVPIRRISLRPRTVTTVKTKEQRTEDEILSLPPGSPPETKYCGWKSLLGWRK
jgi:hypothetical protein